MSAPSSVIEARDIGLEQERCPRAREISDWLQLREDQASTRAEADRWISLGVAMAFTLRTGTDISEAEYQAWKVLLSE